MSASGSDNKIFIWNVGAGEPITAIEFPDIPLSASWSFDGATFVASCKDKKLRIVNARSGAIVEVGQTAGADLDSCCELP